MGEEGGDFLPLLRVFIPLFRDRACNEAFVD